MNRFLAIVWPPSELQRQDVDSANFLRRWEAAIEDVKIDLTSKADEELMDIERIASSTLEAEIKRKDTLEAKAATFVAAPSIATAIAAAVVPLTKDMQISVLAETIIAVLYALALVHLLVSSGYAILARRASGFIGLSALNVRDLLAKSKNERIIDRLAYVRMNEPTLLKKSNQLSVAEDLFLRGLAFLAAASFITLMAHVTRV